jgi:hypothetical protein
VRKDSTSEGLRQSTKMKTPENKKKDVGEADKMMQNGRA